jgi:Membrane-associated lipoprotein involved in thiamine biosynthesis
MNLRSSLTTLPYRCLYLMMACLLAGACGKSQDNNPLSLSGMTMGTGYTVKVNRPDREIDIAGLKNSIDTLLENINAEMSTYRTDSELSKINRAGGNQWIAVPDDLYKVLHEGIRISQLSGGAFDMTVGPLVDLWGFGQQGRLLTIPDARTIMAARENTGYQRIHLQDAPKAIRKDHAAVHIDLSGIAQGYAVDAVAALLEQASLNEYMVEIGGEIRVKGRNPDGDFWRIGIEKPVTDVRSVERIIHLKDSGLATSGDYRNYYEKDGTRYSHIIDPGTGKPVNHPLASVTVLHKECMLADAWATALFVLGPAKGMELAKKMKLPVLFIARNGGGFTESMTDEFRSYITEK